MDPQPEGEIGVWGWERSSEGYLQHHATERNVDPAPDRRQYSGDRYAGISRKQMAKAEGVTEALKRQDQMEWVRRMNSIRNRAEEIVQNELIYSCSYGWDAVPPDRRCLLGVEV